MSNYRRALVKGGTFFFTVVTYSRQQFLINPQCRKILRDAIVEVRKTQPFTIDAWVLLPDHMHCIWTLPKDDKDFSKRWGRIKAIFSKRAKGFLYQSQMSNESKQKHGESTIWQRRFWEHQIRDEKDFNQHVDYIHYNPVKHGYVKQVKDWEYSSFHQYEKNQYYPLDWATTIDFEEIFGE